MRVHEEVALRVQVEMEVRLGKGDLVGDHDVRERKQRGLRLGRSKKEDESVKPSMVKHIGSQRTYPSKPWTMIFLPSLIRFLIHFAKSITWPVRLESALQSPGEQTRLVDRHCKW